eukprot:jgi/Galph1/3630/GphlegSOOS_G2260.1
MRKVDKRAIEKLFQQYKDSQVGHIRVYIQFSKVLLDNTIGPSGLQRLFDDVGVDPSDIVTLIFAWKVGAKNACEFSENEFVQGLSNLQADSLEKLKRKLGSLRKEIEDPTKFKQFYMFIFQYSKDPSQRSLPAETAMALWDVVLRGRFELLDVWLKFLKDKPHNISQDTWNLLYEFARTIQSDLSNYDEDGAWPVLVDEFVRWVKSTQWQKHES